jgi:hypothetical protein
MYQVSHLRHQLYRRLNFKMIQAIKNSFDYTHQIRGF